jgi:SNF2-related domain
LCIFEEFKKWQVGLAEGLIVHNLTAEKADKRKLMITNWSHYGGVMLATEGILKNCLRDSAKTSISTALLTPDVLVLDEAHTLICTETLRYDVLLSIAPRRIVALTGSPFQNNVSQM